MSGIYDGSYYENRGGEDFYERCGCEKEKEEVDEVEEYISNDAQRRLKEAQEDRQYIASLILTSPTINIEGVTARLKDLTELERSIAEQIKKEQKEYEEEQNAKITL